MSSSTSRRASAASAPIASTRRDFFYDNLMMGVQLIHESLAPRRREIRRRSARSARIRNSRRCRSEERPVERLSRRDQRAVRSRQEDAARAVAGLSPAIRLQLALPAAGEPLRAAATISIPRRRTSSPRSFEKCVEAQRRGPARARRWGDGSPTREFLYVDDAANGDPARGRALQRQRADQPRQRPRDQHPRSGPAHRAPHRI